MDRKIRILVAEQDPIFFKMGEDSLKESGGLYEVQEVSSGEECLRMLRNEKFDILLLDHLLPDGSGLSWLQRFNEWADSVCGML